MQAPVSSQQFQAWLYEAVEETPWDILGMTKDEFVSMISNSDKAGFMTQVLDPLATIWNSFREKELSNNGQTSNNHENQRNLCSDSKKQARLAVCLVKWALGNEDPQVWTENLNRQGPTNTCNYVSIIPFLPCFHLIPSK
jgi:hypothetical protein